MTITTTSVKATGVGNGVTTAFAYGFLIPDASYADLYLTDPDGNTSLVSSAAWTLQGAGEAAGGTFTYPLVGSPIATGYILTLIRDIPYQQLTNLSNQGAYYPQTVEAGFDWLAMLLQQLNERSARALTVPPYEASSGWELPDAAARASTFLGFDADGNLDLSGDPADAAASAAAAAASAATAAAYAAALSGTSTTSLSIGTGAKVFTTQAGKQWALGQRLRAASDDGVKIMEGEVTAYSGASLTLNVDYIEDSGTHADWNISLVGARGPQGIQGQAGAGSGDVIGPGTVTTGSIAIFGDTTGTLLDELLVGSAAAAISAVPTARTLTGGNGIGTIGDLSANRTIAIDAAVVAQLTVEDQTVSGGARVTSKSLGTISSGTVTPDPGDRPLQHYTNGGAHTLAPGSNNGSYLLDITNNASAGAITTSGWTKVTGSAFTTTNGHKFRCSASVGNGGSLLVVQALQ